MCLCGLERGETMYTLKTKQGVPIRQMVTCESCYHAVCVHVSSMAQNGNPVRHPIQRDELFSVDDFTEPTEFVPEFPESRQILLDMVDPSHVREWGYDYVRAAFWHGHPGGHLALIEQREALVTAKKAKFAHVDRSHYTQYQPSNPQIAEAKARDVLCRTCTKCKKVHDSRNALFVHLRKSPGCCSSPEDHQEMVNAVARRTTDRAEAKNGRYRLHAEMEVQLKKIKAARLKRAAEGPTVRKAAK
jgi:hypothetical protein